jgi:hypothetical protein
LPLAVTLLISTLSLSLGHYLLLARHPEFRSEARLPRQVLFFFLTTTAVICLVMAAITPRVTKSFSIGDFVSVGEHSGKVSERGLFDAEIQSVMVAAHAAGLKDSYVHILSLGDFSVSYRVSGLLLEAKTLLTCRSRLNAWVLDSLHGQEMGIVSPTTRKPCQNLQAGQTTRIPNTQSCNFV